MADCCACVTGSARTNTNPPNAHNPSDRIVVPFQACPNEEPTIRRFRTLRLAPITPTSQAVLFRDGGDGPRAGRRPGTKDRPPIRRPDRTQPGPGPSGSPLRSPIGPGPHELRSGRTSPSPREDGSVSGAEDRPRGRPVESTPGGDRPGGPGPASDGSPDP